MSVGGVATVIFGVWLLFAYHLGTLTSTLWLPIKLVLVAGLIAYHLYCLKLVRAFRADQNRHGHVYYRWFNEVPAVILIAVVLLAVVRPF
jgi:putative membrane protein